MKYLLCALCLLLALPGGRLSAQTTGTRIGQTRAASQATPKAQTTASKAGKHKAKKPKSGISVAESHALVRPTCTLDSNSVGHYFFPANLGAKWTMRIIMQLFDKQSNVVKTDTSYTFQRVVNDSNTTLQGAPVLELESSSPYKAGGELTAITSPATYYVDDSLAMVVFNHSINSGENRVMLVAPLKVGNHWHDRVDDTIVSEIIAINEPVTVPLGSFSKSIVVRTRTRESELSKYFVPGVGIAKMIYRGWPLQVNGTLVVTTELVALDKGDPTRSISARFAKKGL